jgi:hypothetical protein
LPTCCGIGYAELKIKKQRESYPKGWKARQKFQDKNLEIFVELFVLELKIL